jgi:ferrous iron transport protein A
MLLANASIGQVFTVTRVGGERAFRRRLMELGLVPGTRVEFAGVAPLGDPVKLLVRGCFLSIRRSEAASVEVAPVVERSSVRPVPASMPSLEPASTSVLRVAP